jgi:AcrR family transcriptional regulator
MEKGYAGTSTLEIASRAKTSKRDLYAKFPNKRAVLLACIANRAARMRPPSDLPAPHSRDMLTSILTRLGATVVREVCQPEVIAMFRLAISEAERSPEVAETLNASRSVNRNALAELLAEAQAVGILGHGDPQQMMERFFALLWGDLMVGRLLGVTASPKPAEIDRTRRCSCRCFQSAGSRKRLRQRRRFWFGGERQLDPSNLTVRRLHQSFAQCHKPTFASSRR